MWTPRALRCSLLVYLFIYYIFCYQLLAMSSLIARAARTGAAPNYPNNRLWRWSKMKCSYAITASIMSLVSKTKSRVPLSSGALHWSTYLWVQRSRSPSGGTGLPIQLAVKLSWNNGFSPARGTGLVPSYPIVSLGLLRNLLRNLSWS